MSHAGWMDCAHTHTRAAKLVVEIIFTANMPKNGSAWPTAHARTRWPGEAQRANTTGRNQDASSRNMTAHRTSRQTTNIRTRVSPFVFFHHIWHYPLYDGVKLCPPYSTPNIAHINMQGAGAAIWQINLYSIIFTTYLYNPYVACELNCDGLHIFKYFHLGL